MKRKSEYQITLLPSYTMMVAELLEAYEKLLRNPSFSTDVKERMQERLDYLKNIDPDGLPLIAKHGIKIITENKHELNAA